jgi:RNA polymerase subunit RPABC4/transcription elongation factor Spt4
MIMDKPLRKKRLVRIDSGDNQSEGPQEDKNSANPAGRRLRKVVRLGDRTTTHGSEMHEDQPSEKILATTAVAANGVSNEPTRTTPSPPPERPSFPCMNCGAVIPVGSVRCPACNILYVDDLAGNSNETDPDPTPEEVLKGETILKDKSMAFVHFGVDTGKVTCLQKDQDASDFGLECSNCGVVSEFCTNKCPLCGHDFGEDDTGLVALLEGLKFDLDGDSELDCPSCGEHVKAEGQSCPTCKEFINPPTSHNDAAGVLTILKDRNVVFVHLDVLDGDLSFASKTGAEAQPEQQRVHLDSTDSHGLDDDRKGLARV